MIPSFQCKGFLMHRTLLSSHNPYPSPRATLQLYAIHTSVLAMSPLPPRLSTHRFCTKASIQALHHSTQAPIGNVHFQAVQHAITKYPSFLPVA